MTPHDFAAKWSRSDLGERAASQEHFLDICRLLGQPTPAEADPDGVSFTFEKSLRQSTGQPGFADVWRKGFFAWEYKGRHKDLSAAYAQLQLYRESLGNPPLLVVCDFDRYEIHTNFNNTVKRIYSFTNKDIPKDTRIGDSALTPIQILRALFEDPEALRPDKSQVALTEDAAALFVTLAEDLRKWNAVSDDPIPDRRIAKFVMRMIFCFFAADVGLLPKDAFTQLIQVNRAKPAAFREYLSQLFGAMKDGGNFLMRDVPRFNGGLFDDDYVPPLIADQVAMFERLNALDWSDIEPSIFGTLFERVIDENKRKQLGTHYTSREDIELIVEPVLMKPIRAEWESTKSEAMRLFKRNAPTKRIRALLEAFQRRLADVTALDPACGSGNFLYVSLALLKALEKEVIAYAHARGIRDLSPTVHPRQLFGIEFNEYAHELASAVVWIGYLQWKYRNASDLTGETPILQPLDNIRLADAIYNPGDNHSEPGEPEWPPADAIIGNPPFLGGKLLRRELGDDYVDALFSVWDDRVPREADLCCYWFEKARAQIERGDAGRVGLLATQGIRGGKNRVSLERINDTGAIFWAQSDREWTLDGAAVRVSMVGFDDGSETDRELDGLKVPEIYANLRSGATDVTRAQKLDENLGIAFMGDTKGGAFDIDRETANRLLRQPNPDGRDNADVVRPWINGRDITQRSRDMWIIDFPPGTDMEDAALYEAPFEYVKQHIRPSRLNSKRRLYAEQWWMHMEPRPGFREAASGIDRYIATSQVAKHRLFVWVPTETLPANVVIAFARDDDYFFGVLHSRIHEVWARATGTQLREVESGFRYTPTTTFEKFPFPRHAPDQRTAISDAARHLDELRRGWLNPPDGTIGPTALKRRTLTNLYNAPPTWLTLAHRRLDDAVFAAYGWSPDIPDGELIAALLSLNLQRHNETQADSQFQTNGHDDLLKRITADERILGGKPIIRGMRFAVEHILAMLAAGDSSDEILRQYPILEPEDIQACLTFAHQASKGQEVPDLADIRTSY